MFKNLIITSTALTLLTTASYAAPSVHLIKDSSIGHPYLGAIAGIGIQKVGKEQEDLPAGGGVLQYLPDNKNSSAFLYGIDGGYEFKLGSSNGLLSVGAGIYQNTSYQSKGRIDQVNIPKFNYKYKVLSTRFMAETQLAWQFDINETKKIIPFISLGMGPSLNYANGFGETKIDPAATTESFTSKTKTSFAYQLGAGLAFPFNTGRDRLLAAYRYASLGRPRFGNSSDPTHPWNLSAGKLRANEIYFGYTHLFDF